MRQGFHIIGMKRPKSHFGLTPGQWRIVKALCDGADTRRKMVVACHISERTIGTHMTRIHKKLGTDTAAGIILRVLADDAAMAECFPELRKHDTTASDLREVPARIYFD
jgi:DNA-binding CsgD family transcriptional regulator